MKRTLGVLALLGLVLLAWAGYGEAGTAPDDEWYPLTIPRKMTIRDEFGEEVTDLYMTGGDIKWLYLEADSVYGDWNDDDDFVTIPVTDHALIANITNDNVIGVLMTPYSSGLVREVARVRITALNTLGTQASAYDPQYGRLSFNWDITLVGGGKSVLIGTQTIHVYVLAKDDATGNFDDTAGACNTAGLGSLALLLSLAFIRKRK